MMSNDGGWRRRLAVLAITTSLLSGCATVGSDISGFGTCAPVVEYSRELQARAAEELALLPKGLAVAELLTNIAIMWDQRRVSIRFDGGLSVAEVQGNRIAVILGRANQHLASGLHARKGDFVHAAALDVDPGRTYRFASNGWTAMNQQSNFGTDDLAFSDLPDLRLKQALADG